MELICSLAEGIYSLVVEKSSKVGDKMLEWVCSLTGGIYSQVVEKSRKRRRRDVGRGLFSTRIYSLVVEKSRKGRK